MIFLKVNNNLRNEVKLRKENSMENGINLSLTKSLAEFDGLMDKAIKSVSSKKLSVAHELDEHDSWKFQVGKYVKINNDKKEETALFWIGFGWEENVKHESCIWLEFDAETCPEKYWEIIKNLVGTTGKYFSDVDFKFAQVYMNAWIHFYLKAEYLNQFYDETIPKKTQIEILAGFIDEVLSKI
jgi:hypothetical protein